MSGGGGQQFSSSGNSSGFNYSQTRAVVPPEMYPSYKNAGTGVADLQNKLPLTGGAYQSVKAGAIPTKQYLFHDNGQIIPVDEAFAKRYTDQGIPFDYTNVYKPEDYEWNQATDFTAANPMQIAGADPLQVWASQHATDTWNTPEGEQLALQYGQQAGSPLDYNLDNPYTNAAADYFNRLMLPTIQNQMGLAGLGRSSSLANAMALGQTNYTMPVMQDYLNQQQAEKNRQAGLVSSMSALGAEEFARKNQTLANAQQIGGTMREIAQQPLSSEYQDYLRRQALAEEATFVPFGAFVPSTIGQNVWQVGSTTDNKSGTMSGGSGGFK